MSADLVFILPEKASRLLRVIVAEIKGGRVQKRRPETFISYSEALQKLQVTYRGRAGQALRKQGLDELNAWTKAHATVPKVTGLIIDKKKKLPAPGYAKSHGRERTDWEDWWLAETAKAIDFDWSPYLTSRAPRVEPTPRVRDAEEATAPSYRKIITVEPGKRGGRPCIRGMRITVGDILGWLAAGMSEAEIMDDFPELTTADIHAALAFAADRERHTVSVAAMHG